MGVAQRIERRVVAPKAVGSIPIAHPSDIRELQAFARSSFLFLLTWCVIFDDFSKFRSFFMVVCMVAMCVLCHERILGNFELILH